MTTKLFAATERMNDSVHSTYSPEQTSLKMADDALSIYDEIEIEDMTFDPAMQIYHFPCPCGDRFEIAIDDLRDGEEIAVCPSCSLMIRVIFDLVSFFQRWRLDMFLNVLTIFFLKDGSAQAGWWAECRECCCSGVNEQSR